MTDAPITPLFYTKPRPLNMATDLNLCLTPPRDFKWARETNALPLLADEFAAAAASYPIVFIPGETPTPVAVVGLKDGQNLYVGADGQWAAGCYLPAYIRRYPFLLMQDPAQKQFVLCFDEASPHIGATGEFALFDKGEPSELTKNAMDFCTALHQQGALTEEFVGALVSQQLLTQEDSEIELMSGNKMKLSGFMTIDANKFDNLRDNIVLEWKRKGWLKLIYAQMLSSNRWQDLVDRDMRQS